MTAMHEMSTEEFLNAMRESEKTANQKRRKTRRSTEPLPGALTVNRMTGPKSIEGIGKGSKDRMVGLTQCRITATN